MERITATILLNGFSIIFVGIAIFGCILITRGLSRWGISGLDFYSNANFFLLSLVGDLFICHFIYNQLDVFPGRLKKNVADRILSHLTKTYGSVQLMLTTR